MPVKLGVGVRVSFGLHGFMAEMIDALASNTSIERCSSLSLDRATKKWKIARIGKRPDC